MKNNNYVDIINSIKEKFEHAIVQRCSEKSCDLGLQNLDIYVVLKGELLIGDSKKVCDYIIFNANTNFTIGVIELKGKNPKATEIIEKISNGKDVALDIIKDSLEKIDKPKFLLLVLAKGWDTTQFRKVKNTKIKIGGKTYYIKTHRCGQSFYEAIKES